MVARVVGQDGVLELVGADGRWILPRAQIETLLSLGANLEQDEHLRQPASVILF